MKLFLLFITLATHVVGLSQQKTDERFQSFRLGSSYLREEQQLWIHLPEGYDTSTAKYSVLYVLDADGHFAYMSQYADYLAKPFARLIPPLIVVGIRSLNNAYRHRYFTPPISGQSPDRGNADTFILFLEKELFPEIKQKYRVGNGRIIAGHSVAGLFALYAMTTKPGLFQKVIAVSPSLSYNQGVMFSAFLPAYLSKTNALTRLHFSVAENDMNNYQFYCERLRDTLQITKPSWLKWQYDFISSADHYSIAPLAFYKGLLFLFKKDNITATR